VLGVGALAVVLVVEGMVFLLWWLLLLLFEDMVDRVGGGEVVDGARESVDGTCQRRWEGPGVVSSRREGWGW
jgi:hypothetical protein